MTTSRWLLAILVCGLLLVSCAGAEPSREVVEGQQINLYPGAVIVAAIIPSSMANETIVGASWESLVLGPTCEFMPAQNPAELDVFCRGIPIVTILDGKSIPERGYWVVRVADRGFGMSKVSHLRPDIDKLKNPLMDSPAYPGP